jgi:hypothetical protein
VIAEWDSQIGTALADFGQQASQAFVIG